MNFRLLVIFFSGVFALRAAESQPAEWREYLGGPERNHFSHADQITPRNVANLRVAWEYHTEDPGEMQCNPLVVDGVLYAVSAASSVFALDAATGRERWRHQALGSKANRILRGLTYWKGEDGSRILFTADGWLCAIDARSGEPIASFGEGGRASLKAGLGASAQSKYVVSTTPGALFGDLLIVPTRVSEEANAAPGFIQAFNVRTGKLAWTFHTIPQPGEPGYETWPPDAHKNVSVGGANSWPGMALDAARGLVFVPTGSASPDFWGGHRLGDNRYANCLLALDARTGALRWHFQFVHHDLWDRDLPAPPVLVTVRREGRSIDAVAQVTKSGHVFVFNRDTGESLFPIEEIPVPQAAMPGDRAALTQPRPVRPAPFSRQELADDDVSPFAENRAELLEKFQRARRGAFQIFGKDETLFFPGFDGGAEWGGAAVAPDGVLYVNANEMAWVARLRDTPNTRELANLGPGQRAYVSLCAGCHGMERTGNPASGYPSLVDIGRRRTREEIAQLLVTGKGMMPGNPSLTEAQRAPLLDYLLGTEAMPASTPPSGDAAASAVANASGYAPYQLAGYVKFLDRAGYPAIRPPWGTLAAIDLNTGEHRWRITLGEYPELTAKGIPPTGAENYGGPVVTAGGVLFIAATKDGMFRAFDRETGARLWETPLPAPGFATPCTYVAGGRQFVVVAAGGSKLGTKKGDSFVAFALPE